MSSAAPAAALFAERALRPDVTPPTTPPISAPPAADVTVFSTSPLKVKSSPSNTASAV